MAVEMCMISNGTNIYIQTWIMDQPKGNREQLKKRKSDGFLFIMFSHVQEYVRLSML